jgi:superfamily II DNA/RNA helicase
MKKCSKCGIEKELNIDNFYWRKSRLIWESQCKICIIGKSIEFYQENKEEILVKRSEYYQENKEEISEKHSAYRQEHIEEFKIKDAIYYQENREKILKQKSEYREEHKEEIKEYHAKPENKKRRSINNKIKRQNDPNFKLRDIISNAINQALKKNNSSKNGNSCLAYLPYTIEELRAYLEGQFEPWMSWKNHGKYDPKSWKDNDLMTWVWNIDHIIPHSTFNYTSMEDQAFKDCWALSNLRPLSAKQNILDGVNRTRHLKNKK